MMPNKTILIFEKLYGMVHSFNVHRFSTKLPFWCCNFLFYCLLFFYLKCFKQIVKAVKGSAYVIKLIYYEHKWTRRGGSGVLRGC